ncbi:hypothetical protein [Mycobacteroides abscessus]|uniref:hypothetical protein n=1 Tax=Mycobacteroides abscessus TaxID=36809 RepID=UPI0009440BA4|nr:hypothetical protein [Mycobacteroides abscessus]
MSAHAVSPYRQTLATCCFGYIKREEVAVLIWLRRVEWPSLAFGGCRPHQPLLLLCVAQYLGQCRVDTLQHRYTGLYLQAQQLRA